MQMNSSLILAGEAPNFVNALRDSNAAASEANQVRQQNALRQLYQEKGPDIATGDQNALNALSRFDPHASLGIKGARQGLASGKLDMQAKRQNMEILSAQEKRAIETHAATLSATQRAAQVQQIEAGLAEGIAAYHSGDLNALNGVLSSYQIEPLKSLEDFPMLALKYNDSRKLLAEYNEQFGRPDPLSPAGKVAADVEAGYLPPNQAAGGNDTEAEREIARLQELNFTRLEAIKIKEGVYRLVTDPVTRETVLYDLEKQQVVPMEGGNTPTQPQPILASPPERLTFGNRFEGASEAFGAGGAARRLANTASDSLGFGQPFPEAAAAQRDFSVMRENLTQSLAEAYSGRVPAFLLQNIQELTPQAGAVLEGPEGAQSKLRALGRSLESELATVKRSARNRRSPTDQAKLSARKTALESALAQVSEALGGFDESELNTTSSGIKWKVKQ